MQYCGKHLQSLSSVSGQQNDAERSSYEQCTQADILLEFDPLLLGKQQLVESAEPVHNVERRSPTNKTNDEQNENYKPNRIPVAFLPKVTFMDDEDDGFLNPIVIEKKFTNNNQLSKLNLQLQPINTFSKHLIGPLEDISTENDYVDVKLAEVHNSRNFYLHLDYHEVKQFDNKLNLFYVAQAKARKLSVLNINTSGDCLYCFFDFDYQRYYRVRLIENRKALFIDFGKVKSLLSGNLFVLMAPYDQLAPLALNCCLTSCFTKNCHTVDTLFAFISQYNAKHVLRSFKLKAKFFQQFRGCNLSDNFNCYPVCLLVYDDMTQVNPKWKKFIDFDHQLPNISFDQWILLDKMFFQISYLYHDSSFTYSVDGFKDLYDCVSTNAQTNLQSRLLLMNNQDYYLKAFCPFFLNPTNMLFVLYSLDDVHSRDLECFTTNLTFFYNSYSMQATNQIRSMVVFRYKRFFFRGYVLAHGATYKVLSIDFGFTINLSIQDLYPLLEQFSLSHYPMFACICALDSVIPSKGSVWSMEANEQLRDWVDHWRRLNIKPKSFIQHVSTIYYTGISVVLYIIEEECTASELLVKKRLARWVKQ